MAGVLANLFADSEASSLYTSDDQSSRKSDEPEQEEGQSECQQLEEKKLPPPPKPRIRKRWIIEDTSDPALYDEEVGIDPCMTFPFELDDFQKRAVRRVHRGEHVLVAAHTSAGKTVVGEYAISCALRAGRRAIYTSPIKALSNQKFRDFKQKWSEEGQVGIVTGDVSINPDAPVLIMTTEILRTMVYRGSETVDTCDWVIFDEVHYINDPERGVVWEEVIILLPPQIGLVMLSATLPNIHEFADWIGRTRKKTVYTVETPYRPVPLEHFLYHKETPFLLKKGNGPFVGQQAFKNANDMKEEAAEKKTKMQVKDIIFDRRPFGMTPKKEDDVGYVVEKVNSNDPSRPACRLGVKIGMQVVAVNGEDVAEKKWEDIGEMLKVAPLPVTVSFSKEVKKKTALVQPTKSSPLVAETQRLQRMIKYLEAEKKLPCAVFVFSRKKVDHYAGNLQTLDLTDAEEKSKIHVFFKNAISSLSEQDKQLPQIVQTMDIVKRGIGVHHGGLLPLVKEIIELLFSRGLVKVLFATETFAMGVNMPARSVIFMSIRKHDGSRFRQLLSSEYIQMAGRAGRRGLDETGYVYLFFPEELPDLQDIVQMMVCKSNKLSSQFRITYRMILAMARFSGGKSKMTDLVSNSFLESHRAQRIPTLERDLARAKAHLEELPQVQCVIDPGAVPMDMYVMWQRELQDTSCQLHEFLWDDGRTCDRAFAVGRVALCNDAGEMKKGVIVRITRQKQMLHMVVVGAKGDIPLPKNSFASLRDIALTDVVSLYDTILTKDVMYQAAESDIARTKVAHALQELINDGSLKALPLQSLSKQLELKFFDLLMRRKDLMGHMTESSCCNCVLEQSHLHIAGAQMASRLDIEDLEFTMGEDSLGLMPQVRAKAAVLHELGYLTVDGGSYQCTFKGTCAVEIIGSDEISLVEVLFHNILNKNGTATAAEIAACISSFVFPDKVDDDEWGATDATERMKTLRMDIERIHSTIGNTMVTHHVEFDAEEWGKVCRFAIARIVHAWASGVSFLDITQLSWIQEGTIVKSIVRLDEVLRKLRNVAKLLKNSALEEQLQEASTLIRRDIVFAQSLYLQ